jgi:DNA helicase HerA-like ATPase
VFFFDEAHLLFADASKAFLDEVEQTVKLIRSKGVGVFFCTQLPTDLPNAVLSQLGARIQHAIRAFTPDDQKALTKTVRTYPKTKVYDLESALTSLGTGEAIITVLSERGAPTPVAWTRLRAPRSLMGAIGAEAITAAAKDSPLQAEYGRTVETTSAYQVLTARDDSQQTQTKDEAAPKKPDSEPQKQSWWRRVGRWFKDIFRSPAARSFARSAGTAVGREITRGVMGTGRRRR